MVFNAHWLNFSFECECLLIIPTLTCLFHMSKWDFFDYEVTQVSLLVAYLLGKVTCIYAWLCVANIIVIS